MDENETFLVAGSKPWNRNVFTEVISKYPGKWWYIGSKNELRSDFLDKIKPKLIFFLHWSWKVPLDIIKEYKCICFHMTDVPYGRGGSPLQNLIIRGYRKTKLSALLMTEEFDAGPVYFKEDLCLEGNGEEIFIRASYLSADMIKRIISEEPEPIAQSGNPVIFKRRQAHQSRIPDMSSLQKLHDFIRMLDSEGYPKAFLEYKGFQYEFSRAVLYNGRIVADVKIRLIED
jgi:methionyl-tRNA formyltransferase